MVLHEIRVDLVVEVVSPDKPERDLVEKREDYAEAGVPEYWVVHPEDETITVHHLQGDVYVEHDAYSRGAVATSARLADLRVFVDDVLDAR